MIAARIFNQKEGNPTDLLYGAVTTGTDWKFLKLQGQIIFIDSNDYYIKEIDKIIAILSSNIT
jgi:hypothetical protein